MPKGQYDIARRQHRKGLSLVDRFYEKVAPPNEAGCRLWLGAIFQNTLGYGQFQLDGPKVAHRVAWFIEHGEWPKDRLLHTCDNPPCVEISHLREGSALDNAHDMMAKGRHPVAGKLNEEKVREIRRRHASGSHGIGAELAREFGVSEATISLIVHRKLWASLIEP